MTDAARTAGESADTVDPRMLALFERSRQLNDSLIADNDALDQAWQSGDPLAAIRSLQAKAKAAMDALKKEATNERAEHTVQPTAEDVAGDAVG